MTKLPRNSSGNIELAVVSMKRVVEQPSSESFNCPHPGRDDGGLDEMLSSVAGQEMDTGVYPVSDLEGMEFYWENPDKNMDAIFRPRIDTPFSPSTFKEFDTNSLAENSIPIDEEQDKEKTHPLPTTPVSERSTQTPVMMRNSSFGTKI